MEQQVPEPAACRSAGPLTAGRHRHRRRSAEAEPGYPIPLRELTAPERVVRVRLGADETVLDAVGRLGKRPAARAGRTSGSPGQGRTGGPEFSGGLDGHYRVGPHADELPAPARGPAVPPAAAGRVTPPNPARQRTRAPGSAKAGGMSSGGPPR